MNINILKKELRDYRKSIFFWALGIAFFLWSGMSKYEGYAAADTSISDLLNGLPGGLGAIYGVGIVDLQTAEGFFAIMVLYILLVLGVHAVLLGSGIISKEENDSTAEFLYVKPISRTRILINKTAVAVIIVTLLNILTMLVSLAIMSMYAEDSSIYNQVLIQMPGVYLIQLFFLMVGITFASVMAKPKRAGQLAAGVLIGTFILSAFLDVVDSFSYLEYVTPFKYFDSKEILSTQAYNMINVAVMLAATTLLWVVSKVFFEKRDFEV